MAKKIVAKTNISYGKADGSVVDIAAGDPVDVKGLGMTERQLKDLYDAGALTIEETSEKEEAPVTEEPTSTPTSAPTKAASSAKSNAA